MANSNSSKSDQIVAEQCDIQHVVDAESGKNGAAVSSGRASRGVPRSSRQDFSCARPPHLTDRRTLAELMDACEPLAAAEVRRLLWFVGGQESTARFVFDRVWLAEFKNAAPDWVACREVFRRAYELGRRGGVDSGARCNGSMRSGFARLCQVL